MSGSLRRALLIGALATLCFFRPCAVSAGVEIIVPVGVTASSYYPEWGVPGALIDGSGLTGGTGREATHTNANNVMYQLWHSAAETAVVGQWVEFDLGAAYDVANALVWQLAQENLTARGVQTFTISVAGTNQVFSTYATGKGLKIATGAVQEPVQVVTLAARDIRYVRFTVQSNYGDSYVGLSEVRFEGVLSGPQPLNMIQPVSASASSTYLADPGLVSPQYLIDDSGLTGAGRAATHSPANEAHLFWHSDVNVTIAAQWLEFDLGAAYDVTNALIWQLAQKDNTNRGIAEFRISVAGSDHIYSTYSTGNWLNRSTNLVEEAVQVVPLAAKRIQYVRFEVQSNWGSEGLNRCVGLSEVRFEGALSEPPPTTMILLPLGVSAKTYYDYENHYTPKWLTDGSGLSGIGRKATHTNANGLDLFWHSDGSAVEGQWVEFDLGAAYDVTNALIWQLAQADNENIKRGVNTFTISVAGEDHVFSAPSPVKTLNIAKGLPDEPVQVVPLVASNVRYIKFEIQSNFGDTYVGLSEVHFEVAVPELNTTDVTLAPVGVSASTAYPYMGYYESRFTIDGSGMTGTGRRATHSNANGWSLFWHSNIGVVTSEQWVEFDLGASYDVTNALIWQLALAGITETGVKAFTIKVAGPDHNFRTYSTDNMLNRASSELEQFPRVMPLVAKNIRYVRFEIQSNWGRPDGGVGLSEVRFEVTPPETDGFIRSPVASEASSSYVVDSEQFLIDGSGLTGTDLAATHGDGLGETSMWLSNYGTVANQWVEFDLGTEFKLVSAAIWQYNQTEAGNGQLTPDYLPRGVKSLTIYTAGSDKNYAEYGTFQLARGLGLAAEPAQLVNLKTSNKVRYVKFAANASWGSSDMVGLSEVRFVYKRTGTLLSLQ